MAMGKRERDRQPTMWVATTDLPTATSHPFYTRLNQLLREQGFVDFAEAQCATFYAETMARPAHRLGVERCTLRFGEIVEPLLAQQLIQARVERVTRGCREVRRRHPHSRLSVALAFAHRHVQSLVQL